MLLKAICGKTEQGVRSAFALRSQSNGIVPVFNVIGTEKGNFNG